MRLNTIAVQKYMIDRELKNVDVARTIGVTPQAVSEWVCGNNVPSWDNFGKLVTTLGVTANDLLILNDEGVDSRGANGRGDGHTI